MADTPAATLRLSINREALAANWRVLDIMSGHAATGAAVKANAYGLGLAQTVPSLIEAGCRSFFVAHWEEARNLLEYVGAEQISVLHGLLNPTDAQFAMASGVRPVINSLYQANIWAGAGGGACDVMIDTGINRLGLSLDEAVSPLIQELKIETLMSHLASADEDSVFNHKQLERFQAAVQNIPARRYSLANSAGIALGADYAFDLTRPGLALYGGIPRTELDGVIRPVVQISAAILQTRMLKQGDTVGYNASFCAAKEMKVGVVSIGYADGFLRSWSGQGQLRMGSVALPVLGKISMDMSVVDLSNAPDCLEGDWLDIPYHLPVAAQQSGLSQYELLTILGQRFGR